MNCRKIFKYDDHEKRGYELKKRVLLCELEVLEYENKMKIYDNQKVTGYEILSKLKNRAIINILTIAKTQSGKTSTMASVIKYYLLDTEELIPLNHIYIITGLSSREWKQQTVSRMPAVIQQRVFHRCDLQTKFSNDINNKQNVLILIDEVHVASRRDMTICNVFKQIGLLNRNYLYDNDVRIIEFSATPEGTIYDLLKWSDNSSALVFGEAGVGYTSAYDLLIQNRVKQYRDLLTDKEALKELKCDIDKYDTPRYHIIRTKKSDLHYKTIDKLKQFFNISYNFITYDGYSDIDDINDILKTEPLQHTFIIIIELMRCSKTLYKKYLGILYERYVPSCDDSVIIQGSVGRCTGYDDNGKSIIYTNIDSILKYEALFSSKFNNTNWRSRGVTRSAATTGYCDTINDPRLYEKQQKRQTVTNMYKTQLKIFDTQDEARTYFNDVVKPTIHDGVAGPRLRRCAGDGYYYHTVNGVCKIQSCNDIDNGNAARHVTSHILNRYRLIPCYKDVNDKSTLEWRLYYCVRS